MEKLVIVVNGKPRAGKDTLIGFMEDHLRSIGARTIAFSSIDPVKQLMANARIDTSAKTPADRDLLAEVGDALERHSNWRTNRSVEEIHTFSLGPETVFFLHMREPELIAKVEANSPVRVVKIYLHSNRGLDLKSNASDAGTWRDDFYDIVLSNEGSLADLKDNAEFLLQDIGLLI